jgi:amino acid adenylation domain-containing protein
MDFELPLTPLQNGILFHALREQNRAAYVEQLCCFVEGDLHVEAFRRAWQTLVRRHDALRVSFHWDGAGQPIQRVQSQAIASVMVVDATHDLDALCRQERETPFDLRSAPLMRIVLVRLPGESHALIWTHHHLILDGWSVGILVQDLIRIYNAECEPRAVPADPPVRSFAPFVRWLMRQDQRATLAYWRDQLAGFRQPTLLRGDGGANPGGGHNTSRSMLLNEGEERDLRTLGKTLGCSSFTLIAAAWSLVLARITGQRDVMFGATISGRPCSLPAAESMVGMFINTIPMRVRLPKREPVRSWLRQLEDLKQLGVDTHSHAPLSEVLKPVCESTRSGAESIFNTLLVYENYPLPKSLQISPRLSLREVRCTERTSYELTLIVVPSPRMEFSMQFDASRHSVELADRLLEALRCQLERLCQLAADPARTVGDALEVSGDERRRVLSTFADGGRGWTDEQSAGARIEQLIWNRMEASGCADAIAVSSGSTQWTYGYLRSQASQIAARLAKLDVQPDDRIGLCAQRGPWLLAGALGILEAGGCYVPIDPEWPLDRRRWIAEDAGVKAILADDAWQKWDDVVAPLLVMNAKGECAVPGSIARKSAMDLAYVIYTSGSTGTPKGVMVHHAGVVNRLRWMNRMFPLTPSDRVLQKTPATFDVSVWELFLPLIMGARVVFARPGGHRDSRYISEEMRRRRIGMVHFVPSMLNAFLEDRGLEHAGANPPRWLKRVIASGEALSPDVARRFWTSAGAAGYVWRMPDEGLFNLYGPTEASVDVTSWPCAQQSNPPHSVPIGKPIDGIQLYVLGAEMEVLPEGSPGELCIGGIGVARGYLGRAALTGSRFVPDPFGAIAGRRLYCTGDLARWRTDGALEYLGRLDHQVKIRGIRVEPEETSALLATHPNVREAVVIASQRGAAEAQLVGYIVRRDRALRWQTERQLLMDWVRDRVPEYLIPSAIVEMPDGLPLNGNGKVDRRALPDPIDEHRSDQFAGLSAIEEVVSEIWSGVLGLPSGTRMGADDNFLRCGGDSLRSLQAVARMSAYFGVDVGVAAIWASPTLRGAAREVERLLASKREPLSTSFPPESRHSHNASAPLSSAQRRLWFVNRLNASAAALHNVSCCVWLDGELHAEALQRAFCELSRRHDVLRTEFHEADGNPYQRIRQDATIEIEHIDLNGGSSAACLAVAREQMRKPFDLTKAPLARAILISRGPASHALALTLHHITCDGLSAAILMRDVCHLYADLPVPRPRVQYADYAIWQNEAIESRAYRDSRAFWQQKLQGLPTGHGLPASHGSGAALMERRLPASILSKMRSLKRELPATTFMLVLAAFQTVLWDLTGRTDIVVGTDVSDRPFEELWEVAGFFINQLVLRTSLSGDLTYAAVIDRVRETCVQAYANQHVQYEELVRDANESSHQDRSLFQLKLVQQQPLELSFEIGELKVSPMALQEPAPEFDLILNFAEGKETLTLLAEFRQDRLSSESVGVMLDRLEAILEVSSSNWQWPLGSVAAAAKRGSSSLEARVRKPIAVEVLR